MVFDLKTIAERIGGRLDGPSDLRISRLAGIERAVAGDLSYVGSVKFAPFISTTGASALIVAEGVECALPAVRVKDATAAFTLALALFAPKRSELFPAGVHPSAAVDETAELGAGVHVGAQAVVGPGCRVGDRAVIGAGTVLQNGAEVGADSLLYPNVSVQHGCVLGERVIVHCGAVIGSDGFGFSRLPDAVHKIPQIGIVRWEMTSRSARIPASTARQRERR